MLHMMKILVSAAFVLGAVSGASAATKHRRAVHASPSHYSTVPSYSSSNACPPVPPCFPQRDDW